MKLNDKIKYAVFDLDGTLFGHTPLIPALRRQRQAYF